MDNIKSKPSNTNVKCEYNKRLIFERHEDGLRLCRRVNHPNFGIVFCGLHWYATGGGDIVATPEEAAPYMKQANLAGGRRDPFGWGGVATVEPLDKGELDNFAMLGALKKSVLKVGTGVAIFTINWFVP